MKKIILFITIIIVLIFAIGYYFQKTELNQTEIQDMELMAPKEAKIVEKTLILTNDNNFFKINDQKVDQAIRVPEKTLLKVKVKNKTKYGTSLHFHGVQGLSKMDGIGGVTQKNIKPNQEFTYQFYLDDPGSYMYHAHVDSAEQVNNQYLFGSLVVETSEEKKAKNKKALIFNANTNVQAHHNAAGAANFVTVNGEELEEVKFNNQDEIYLDISNIASVPLSINFGSDIKYQILSADATEVFSDPIINEDLIIPAANRISVKVTNPQSSFIVSTSLKGKKNAQFGVNINGTPNYQTYENVDSKIKETENNGAMMGGGSESALNKGALYLYKVINSKESLNLESKSVDKYFDLGLSMTGGNSWGINGATYPNTKEMIIQKDDIVEVTLTNDGDMNEDHPFHLHGHKFQVLEYNNEKVEKNLVLDTVNVRPNEKITIRFKADNPGVWSLHCHDLTHADKGMMTIVRYKGYYSKVQNKSDN